MSAAKIRKEREFWSRQLDTTSIEERRALPDALRWIDADQPKEPLPRPTDPPTDRFTLWDV